MCHVEIKLHGSIHSLPIIVILSIVHHQPMYREELKEISSQICDT